MLSKRNKIIILSSVIVIAITSVLYRFYIQSTVSDSYYDKDCSAVLKIRDNAAGFHAQLNLFLHLKKNNTGYLDLSGNTFSHDQSYNTARSYNFNIQKQSGSIYHLTNIKLSKRTADNTVDEIMNKLIFSFDSVDGRYVRITRIDDAYVVGNLYSPVFICVITQDKMSSTGN